MRAYGNDVTLSRYAGQAITFPERTAWQHGWIPSFATIDSPEIIVGEDGRSRFRKDWTYYVARPDQVETLRGFGYSSVAAIGLPITYAPRPENLRREPESLLAVPWHSSAAIHDSLGSHDHFADYLARQAGKFSRLTVLIHGWDWEMGVNAIYERYDLEVLRGAKKSDAHSLDRVASLFQSHETVVSNYLGSPIAYAAYLGARVAVVDEPPQSDLRAIYRSQIARNCIECAIFAVQWEVQWRKNPSLSFLLRAPEDAETATEWGRFEVGETSRLAANEIAALFGATEPRKRGRSHDEQSRDPVLLSTLSPDPSAAMKLRSAILRLLPETMRVSLRLARAVAAMASGRRKVLNVVNLLLGRLRNFDRVRLSARGAAGGLSVVGEPSDIAVATRVFVEDPLGLLSELIKSSETILDVGAYRGYSTQRLRHLNEHADIIAIEPRADHFNDLRRNVARLQGVRVIQSALWTDEGTVELAETGEGGAGTTILRSQWAVDAPIFTAPAITWRSLERSYIDAHRRTLLLMDIEGAEGSLLQADGPSIIASCDAVVIAVRGHQGVSEDVLKGLMDAYSIVRFDMTEVEDLLVIQRIGANPQAAGS